MTSNGAYHTEELINSILQLSFAEKLHVSKSRLNKIAFIIEKEHERNTGQKIINEQFTLNTFNKPTLKTLNHKLCRCFEQDRVEHYVDNGTERTTFIKDDTTRKIVHRIWHNTKAMSITELNKLVESYC